MITISFLRYIFFTILLFILFIVKNVKVNADEETYSSHLEHEQQNTPLEDIDSISTVTNDTRHGRSKIILNFIFIEIFVLLYL